MMSPEEAVKVLDYEEWLNKYEAELDIYWHELGCNYELGNEFENWVETFYYDNGGLDM